MDKLQLVTEEEVEKVILVGVLLPKNDKWVVQENLDELYRLARSSGVEVVKRFICKQRKIRAGYYIGTGKAQQLAEWVAQNEVDTLIFDEELSPAQVRNLQETLDLRVIDRTQLILDIFAQHATTKEGRVQVELAQLQYLSPRLRNMWSHLSRQKGGIGLRGPGEKQIEVDRRQVQNQIIQYKKQLRNIQKHREEQRKNRRQNGWSLVSLVGYTNAGKSTLINSLAEVSDAYVDDKLFATLDATTRKVDLPNHEPLLLSDTVGFIRKLPHSLVESFKATLEEVVNADMLIHVIDASHPQVDEQIEAVHQVLNELNVRDKPILNVLNKIDTPEGAKSAKRLKHQFDRSIAISAKQGDELEELKIELADCLKGKRIELKLKIPLAEGRFLAKLHKNVSVLDVEYESQDALLLVRIPARMYNLFKPYIIE